MILLATTVHPARNRVFWQGVDLHWNLRWLVWLVKQVEHADAPGFKMPAGQHVPPEALHRGEIDGETLIVSVSYCWASKGHGDPKLTTTKQICKVLKYLMASRHYKDCYTGELRGIGNVKLLVFLDYMSLPQSSAGATVLHRQQFGLGLGGVNVLYAHSKTLTLLCTESHLNHVDGPDARTAYDKSGWPVFEREVTALGLSLIHI